MKAPRSKSTGGAKPAGWTVFTMFGLIALIWAAMTLMLIPQELADIESQIKGKNGVGVYRIPLTDGEGWRGRDRNLKGIEAPPKQITMEEITGKMNGFLQELHNEYAAMPHGPVPEHVWDVYKATTDKWLLGLDRDWVGQTYFPVRDDHSIFVSIASYRDENCANTLTELYSHAASPDKVFVGLVQQNCLENCRSGVLEKGEVVDVAPDPDCYQDFAATELGKMRSSQIRNFFVNESESLGPAVARYFASKLWHGETYFMQIDSHSMFEYGWDTSYVSDIVKTPSYPKSVLTQYPPSHDNREVDRPGVRICSAIFATSDIEADIIRLGAAIPYDSAIQEKPCPAPFVGAGFYFAHASFLKDVPYDPYPAWVFMGEEILISLRFWTWGYDMYSPTRNKISHIYVRRHKPKFWETVGRLFHKPGIHNAIQLIIINRVKNIIGYPESSSEVIKPKSLLDHLELYGDGPVRPLHEYMQSVGLDIMGKRVVDVAWCSKCQEPFNVFGKRPS